MADTALDIEVVHQWLADLHGHHDTGFFTISALHNGRMDSTHFPVGAAGVDEATQYVRAMDARGASGIYVRMTSCRERPVARGKSDLSQFLTGLWGDVDLDGPGHKHNPEKSTCRCGNPLPASEDDARRIIAATGLPDPSAWVDSGGGRYPLWFLAPAPDITDRQPEAKRLLGEWQDIIGHTAHQLGFHYGTENRDLARVLRIPGTVNRKVKDAPTQARIVERTGVIYTVEAMVDVSSRLAGDIEAEAEAERQRELVAAAAVASAPARPMPVLQQPASGQWNDDGIKPGEAYNEAVTYQDVVDLVVKHGATIHSENAEQVKIRRPGKIDEGHSATVDKTTKGLWNFSGDYYPFPAHSPGDKGERPFSVYALLEHGGDYSAAGSALRALGYGSPSTPASVGSAPFADGPAEERTGRNTLPGPHNPMAAARELSARLRDPHVWWEGDFYRHLGTHWKRIADAEVQRWIYRQTEYAVYEAPGKDGETEEKMWLPNRKKIGDITDALAKGVISRFGDVDKVMSLENGVLHLHKTGEAELLHHHPGRFNLFSLPFAYDPDATCPEWEAFLNSSLPDDTEAHEFLAEWFGYVLSGRTEKHKMVALIGEKRSGKGTIARVLGAMLGAENVTGLDLNQVGGAFGLQPYIGKALAVDGDVRWHSRSIADAVPILLRITGDDVVTVHRKNKEAWEGRLGTRLMVMSNDTPTFSDRSGALASRLIYVKFDESFYGREDFGLEERLLTELPGILNWALAGLARLNARGRFSEPKSGLVEAEEARRLSDPVGTFIDDWVQFGDGRKITGDQLLLRYKGWCEVEGRTKDGTTSAILARDLRSKLKDKIKTGEIYTKREREGGKFVTTWYGIGVELNGPPIGNYLANF